MSESLSKSARRVQDVLDAHGLSLAVVELPASTRSAREAAEAIGCTVAQIAKSLIFRALETDRPVLVIASGPNRVDEGRVARALGEAIGKADADYVRERTGFAIGGIPPVGHIEPIPVFIDDGLFQYETLWAAAGTPHAVFSLTPDDLFRMTNGTVMRVGQRSGRSFSIADACHEIRKHAPPFGHLPGRPYGT